MKKVLVGTLAVATLFGGTTSVLAAEGDTATTLKKQAEIKFTKDDDSGVPVDPTDPTVPVDPIPTDPTDPTDPINPNGAELMITYASNLDFGEQSKSGTSFNAKAIEVKTGEEDQTEYMAPFVSLKDSRGTEREGWSLRAKLDEEFNDGENVLAGAELHFSNLITASTHEGAPVVTPGQTALTVGEDLEIAKADINQGIGLWAIGLGELETEDETPTTDGVVLKVPSTTLKNQTSYKTSVTYTLIAEPA